MNLGGQPVFAVADALRAKGVPAIFSTGSGDAALRDVDRGSQVLQKPFRAGDLARALSAGFDVSLIYSFEKRGVLMDAEDDRSLIARINAADYADLKARQVIFAGMIPKLDNAFAALRSGVKKVIIGRAEELPLLLTGESGTTIIHE